MNCTGKRIIQKILAILIIISMTMANLTMVGMNLVSYAADFIEINNSNVRFNAYFKDGSQSQLTTQKLDEKDLKLAIELGVSNDGYFTDGKIQLDDNANFKFKTDIKDEHISKIEDKTIYLKQINGGDNITIEVGIEFAEKEEFDLKYLGRTSNMSLSGTYVNSKSVNKKKNISIEGNAKLTVNWTSSDDIDSNLGAELLTNSVYKVNEEDKRIVQLLVLSKVKDNSYPVQDTKIELNIPNSPESVVVNKRTTKATNGDSVFEENNYQYADGKLTINVENGQNNKIKWLKNSYDAFVVTIQYSKNTEIANSTISINSKLTTYDSKTLEQNAKIVIDKETENLVSVEEVENQSSIAKGNLYAKQEKGYSTTTKLYVNYATVINGISLEENEPVFVKEKNDEGLANVEYVRSIINKNEFISLFGEDGTLELKDQNGNIVSEITSSSKTDDNGNFVIEYNDVSKLEILSSKPENNGTLNIINEKKISKLDYSREEIKELSSIKDNNRVIYTKNDDTKNENKSTATTGLAETASEASFKSEQSSLTVSRDSQELDMTVVLKTNDETKDLYKNPAVRITFPEQINKVSAQYKLLYGNGLEINSASVDEINGRQALTINLKGKQNSYSDEAVEGATILIKANVNLNQLSTNSDEKLILNYTNENATRYVDNGEITKKLSIISENSMILTNNMREKNVYTLNKENDQEVNLEANSSPEKDTIRMQVINNEEADISNTKILGTIANIDGKIARTNAIQVNKDAKVYYTTAENPNADLNNPNNGWTTDNIKDAKHYLVELGDVKDKQEVDLSYNIAVSENLGYNLNTQTGYAVSYTNSLTGNEKTVEATNLLITTGNKAELKTEIKAKVGGEEIKENDEVKAGEIVTYEVNVKNTGKEDSSDFSIEAKIPDNMTLLNYNPKYGEGITEETANDPSSSEYYIESSEKSITKSNLSIKAGESTTCEIMLRANENITSEQEAKLAIKINYQDENSEELSFTTKLTPANVSIVMNLQDRKPGEEINSNYSYRYIIAVKNLTNEKLKDVKVTVNNNKLIELGDLIARTENDEDASVEQIGGAYTIKEINPNGAVYLYIFSQIKTVTDDIRYAEISANAEVNGSTVKSSKLSNPVIGVEVKTELNTKTSMESGDSYLHPGDIVNYEIDAKNIGNIDSTNLKIHDNVSDYLDIKSVTLNGNSVDYEKETIYDENYNTIIIDSPLKSNENAKINIQTKVNENLKANELLKVINKASAYDNILVGESEESTLYIESIKSNEGSNDDDNNNTNNNTNNNANGNGSSNNFANNSNSNNNSNATTYTISGVAWFDANQNGSRDSSEQLLSGIKLYAINATTNKIAKDALGTEISATTDNSGFYTLANMPRGKYIIVFEYDTDKYIVTTYQADGVSANKNSDAVKATMKINGQDKTVAATDSIELTESKANIDLGLTEAKTFDLELEKAVSKVVVTNASGTKTYNFKDTNLAKVEIRSKYLNGSNVLVEYKIKVKNTGEVAGYAKNIVDYMPSTLSFSSSLNKDWYQKGNYIYNSSLADTKIEPGEEKEIKLILTKSMTESNTGLTNNKAEINSAYNLLNIDDTDSTPGNNKKDEDDMGSADVIITVSTGTAASYVVLTLSIVIAIAGISYIIYRKFLTEKIEL